MRVPGAVIDIAGCRISSVTFINGNVTSLLDNAPFSGDMDAMGQIGGCSGCIVGDVPGEDNPL